MSDTTDTEPVYLWADLGAPKVRHILSASSWAIVPPGTGYGLCGQWGETAERAAQRGRTVDLTLPLCKTCAKRAGIAVTPPLEAALSIDTAGEVRFRVASSATVEVLDGELPWRWRVNAAFLRQAIEARGEDTVTLRAASPAKPLRIKGDDIDQILMTVKLS